MGKTTLFHPVSLNVIRGAAEYGGFRLGKITQMGFDPQTGTARYRTELVHIPSSLRDASNKSLADAFQSLFAADLTVTEVWFNRSGDKVLRFSTHVKEAVSDATD